MANSQRVPPPPGEGKRQSPWQRGTCYPPPEVGSQPSPHRAIWRIKAPPPGRGTNLLIIMPFGGSSPRPGRVRKATHQCEGRMAGRRIMEEGAMVGPWHGSGLWLWVKINGTLMRNISGGTFSIFLVIGLLSHLPSGLTIVVIFYAFACLCVIHSPLFLTIFLHP